MMRWYDQEHTKSYPPNPQMARILTIIFQNPKTREVLQGYIVTAYRNLTTVRLARQNTRHVLICV